MTDTAASVRFGANGAAVMDASVRLSGSTYVRCCTYDDAPPILVIEEPPVDISITTPDRKQVTEEDIKLAQAIRLFKRNTEAHPESGDAFDGLGEAYREKGDRVGAIAAYEKALALSHDDRARAQLRKALDRLRTN